MSPVQRGAPNSHPDAAISDPCTGTDVGGGSTGSSANPIWPRVKDRFLRVRWTWGGEIGLVVLTVDKRCSCVCICIHLYRHLYIWYSSSYYLYISMWLCIYICNIKMNIFVTTCWSFLQLLYPPSLHDFLRLPTAILAHTLGRFEVFRGQGSPPTWKSSHLCSAESPTSSSKNKYV